MVTYPAQSVLGECTALTRPARFGSAPSYFTCRNISGVAPETLACGKASGEPQERNQHRNATAIRSIGILTKFSREEAFLHAGLQPHPERDQRRTQYRGHCSDRDTRDQHPRDKPRIDRVAHQPVGAGVDDLMAFLVRDRVRPETSEMNPRPPCERDPRKDKTRQHVDTEAAELPERLFPQNLALHGKKRIAPTKIGKRYLNEPQGITGFFVLPDQDDA